MNRYARTKKSFDREEGRLVGGFRITPEIDDKFTFVVTTEESETLESLAFKYYGSEKLWWIIADANPLQQPLTLVAGTKIRIIKREYLTGERLAPRNQT